MGGFSLRISEVELEYSDIEWFAIDKNQKIVRLTSGLYGYVPDFVCSSKENAELLCVFFDNLPRSTTSISVQGENFGTKLLDECQIVSQKGIYCFDAFDGQDDTTSYTKISVPKQPLYFYELPENVQDIIRSNFIDADVETENIIHVLNAY